LSAITRSADLDGKVSRTGGRTSYMLHDTDVRPTDK
jgi:hypothetical protein